MTEAGRAVVRITRKSLIDVAAYLVDHYAGESGIGRDTLLFSPHDTANPRARLDPGLRRPGTQ